MITPENLIFLIIEFFLGMGGAWIIGRYAIIWGLIDTPSERSSHILLTPKGGGVGTLSAFILGCFIFKLSFIFSLSVIFLSILSLMGDRTHIPPKTRLFCQFITVFVIVFHLDLLSTFHNENILPLNYGLIFLVVFFIVGTANFYNFMDGINGIAGITGVIAFGLLAWYGLRSGKNFDYSMLSAGLALSCLGFLPFNIPKAKVFMGDVGSILLGLVFAVIVVVFSQNLSEFIVLSGFLFPFYADEIVTIVERLRDRQSLLTPHRRHLYQVLANEAEITHWKVSLVYGVSQLLVGISLCFMADIGILYLLTALSIFVCLFLTINFQVKRCFPPRN